MVNYRKDNPQAEFDLTEIGPAAIRDLICAVCDHFKESNLKVKIKRSTPRKKISPKYTPLSIKYLNDQVK